MDTQVVKDFTELMATMRKAMDQYLLSGDLPGVACAAGTMTARINNLRVITAAYENREPNTKDRFELSSVAATLAWLGDDKDCLRDFTGIKLVLPDTAFNAAHPDIAIPGEIEYKAAMGMLHSAIVKIVLEDNPVPLSA